MPSTRRAFLAAALAAAAGCSGGPDERTTPRETATGTGAGRTGTTDDGPTTTSGDGDATPEAPGFTRWAYEPSVDAVGTLTLAPGPDGPAVYVGSAAGDSGSGAGSLAAVALPDGRERWRVSLPNHPMTAPRYGGDGGPPRLYLETGRETLHGEGATLHAIDPERGEQVWTFAPEEDRFVFPMAASDSAVFVGRRDDRLQADGEYVYALAAADGTERWRVESGDAADEGHAVRRDTLVYATHRGVRARDPASGEERWHVDGDVPISGPAYGSRSERLFVGVDGGVRGLGLVDGEEQWHRAFEFTVSRVIRPRAAASTSVFVGDYDGRLVALSPLDGSTRWTYPVDADRFHPGVARTSESLFVDGAGVHCLDPVSGERRWAFEPDVDGTLRGHVSTTAFATDGERLWALDPGSGDVRWEYAPAAGLDGVVSAGDLAVVASGGTVRALDGSRTG